MWGLRQCRVVGHEHAAYDYDDMSKAEVAAVAKSGQESLDPDASVAVFAARIDGMSREDIVALMESRRIRDTSRVQGLYLDDAVTMESGKTYAVRAFSEGGPGVTYSVGAEPLTTSLIYLTTDIPASAAPGFDCLIHFGEAERETHDCLVAAIEPGDNQTAVVTLQDYSVDRIMAALTGPIPPWNSDVTLPSRWMVAKPAAPVITGIISDERVHGQNNEDEDRDIQSQPAPGGTL